MLSCPPTTARNDADHDTERGTDDVYLDHLFVAVGEESRSVDEAAASGLTLSSAAALRAAGFDRHHIAGPATNALDLAVRAAEPIRSQLTGIDALVWATCIPTNANLAPVERFETSGDVKHLMDFPACRFQTQFDLGSAAVFGLAQQACTGMLGALRIARALLTTEPQWERVLCLTADRFPAGARYEQAYNLISDGAAGCIVSRRRGGYRILGCHHLTNGAMVDADDDETVGAWFSYSHRVATELLTSVGMAPCDVAWIVPQNTHINAWTILARMLGVGPDRVVDTRVGVGHMISGDNIVNLAELDRRGLVQPGDRLLLLMAGFGMHWSCVLLEKEADVAEANPEEHA